MKKCIALFLFCFMITTSAYASDTHLIRQPSDIKVFLHGKEIPSCAVNNAMYIAADDFKEYGYAVTYVDEVRTLFVNKTGVPSDIMPEKCEVKKAQETDIQVMLNGELLVNDASFAANGKMYVNTSVIARYRDGLNGSDSGTVGYPHLLTSVWDGEKRTYSIDDSPLSSKEEKIAGFLSWNGNREQMEGTLGFTENFYPGENFDIVSLRVGGLPHGASTSWMYIDNNGKSYSINEVTRPFRMYNGWGNCSIKNPWIEGRRFYFEGSRTMNLAVPSDGGAYSGTYYLDLDTTVVNIVEEEKIY